VPIDCTEHQLQDRSLAESVGDDFQAAAFFREQSFTQVRSADRSDLQHALY
jgi:hypothetical protein